MKKIAILIILAICFIGLILSLVIQKNMTIKVKETKDEFNNTQYTFSYKVDDGIKNFAINLWKKENENWVCFGTIYDENIKSKDTITLTLKEDVYKINNTTYKKPFRDEEHSGFSQALEGITPIKANEEIFLYNRYAYLGSRVTDEMDILKNLQSADKAIAITLKFY